MTFVYPLTEVRERKVGTYEKEEEAYEELYEIQSKVEKVFIRSIRLASNPIADSNCQSKYEKQNHIE